MLLSWAGLCVASPPSRVCVVRLGQLDAAQGCRRGLIRGEVNPSESSQAKSLVTRVQFSSSENSYKELVLAMSLLG